MKNFVKDMIFQFQLKVRQPEWTLNIWEEHLAQLEVIK